MRTLFLDKPTSRITTRQWLLIGAVLAAIEAAALAAYFMRPAPATLAASAASPQAQCEARGADDFRSRNEWPRTADGRDANTLVTARCTLDPQAFPQVFR
jgi:hypothetical protein